MASGRAVLSFMIPMLPIPWSRARGRGEHRFKPESLRDWQEVVKDAARQEMDIQGVEMVSRVEVEILVLYPSQVRLDRAPDLDNIAKGILDAMTGVVYPDDRPRWVGRLVVEAGIAGHPGEMGTYVSVIPWAVALR